MVMETPGPQEVGREFVRQYYTMLHEAPLHLHRFYSNNSAFVHGGVEKAGCEQPPVIGQEAIHKKIVSLNFNDCHAKIRQVDAQATVEDSVVVQVTGELSNNGEPMRRFMQTFVLVPQTPKKFYVHNDIFRYQDEVFHDEESEAEEDHTAFIIDPREETLDNAGIQERVSAGPEVTANYYLQEPVSNGPVHEVEALKNTETAAAVVASPQSLKPQVESVPEPEASELEEAPVEEDRFEPKVESKPVPVVEQPEYHEPQPEAKPVTWAALASKNAAGGWHLYQIPTPFIQLDKLASHHLPGMSHQNPMEFLHKPHKVRELPDHQGTESRIVTRTAPVVLTAMEMLTASMGGGAPTVWEEGPDTPTASSCLLATFLTTSQRGS
ncbi:unnamed protein product [Candidula unifasciata]|uniref:NTF2 domain-containing protein n=1 Tax=Candidula unifasciata TaxID=100452 RepID=A0A8S3Z323_9EUPU|nr:unnamed protein product [Candidula unifasciata]